MAESHAIPAPDEDIEAVWRMAQSLPRERQIALAQRILRAQARQGVGANSTLPDDPGLATLDPQTRRPRVPSAALRGIAAGGKPAPTDEQVAQWRLEKYDAQKYDAQL